MVHWTEIQIQCIVYDDVLKEDEEKEEKNLRNRINLGRCLMTMKDKCNNTFFFQDLLLVADDHQGLQGVVWQ
jgi:hypothetical protein